MHAEHHEKQTESILNYLEEPSFHCIEKMKERFVIDWIIMSKDFDKVKTKLQEARTQILELQKKHMGQRDKISFVRFRISDLEITLEDIQDHHLGMAMGKFDAKADDGYFLGYSFLSKAFRVFNTIRQQVEETYHVTFDESMEAIRFTNTSVDEIGINNSSRYPPNEVLHEDDPSRQYQANSDISYYVISHGRSLIKLTQEKHVLEVIASNEPDTPHTKDAEGPPDLTNTKGTHEQNVQDEQIITQSTEGPLGNNTEVLVPTIES
ncbi:hypothetical protein Tco_0833675 [Tanacetum coccineum]